MPLHPVKLPKSAPRLFMVLALQKKLLKALADPDLNSDSVDTAWVQNVWRRMDPDWVRKCCLGGQQSILHPLKTIAAADPAARQALFEEFCRQQNVKGMLNSGGDFRDIETLPGFTPQLANAVKLFFKRCYSLLSHDANRKWCGYEFNGPRFITNHSYKEDFCRELPAKTVCPYCDGDIGTPELDHYLCKSGFPLLACSPWNLVPVCSSCNDVVTAKGDRPAITPGPPRSMDEWLHPFFRPASQQVRIRLNGAPADAIPQLYSPDATEQTRLDNHTDLIRSLEKRWTNKAAAYYDVLVSQVNEKIKKYPLKLITEIVQERLEDHNAARGRNASSMIHAAVCQAIIDQRPEYNEEFAEPNAPALL